MGDLVNLRRAKKQRTRAGKDKQAGENRARFGRTKAEKDKAKAEEALAKTRHAGHKLDNDE